MTDLHFEREVIAEKIFAYDLSQVSELADIKAKYLEDTIYTIRFLANALLIDEKLVFINYMKWFGDLAYYLEFNLKSMERHFKATIFVFEQIFNDELFIKIKEVYEEGVKAFIKSYTSEKDVDFIYDDFISFLIDMQSDKAYKYIEDRINEGMSLKNIYLQIFQPTLYKVGLLWQQRVISVAKEHYITALIQHIIGRLYSFLFAERSSSRYSVTAVCAGNELHEIGMRMVADFFEMDGWDSVFLGSNLPVEMIINHLHDNPTDLLSISATTASQILDVKTLIDRIKADDILSKIKILVGGRAFNDAPGLWKKVGADNCASDAEQALIIGKLLVGENNG
jgi:methanogenic corrinoid protein MtbC1